MWNLLVLKVGLCAFLRVFVGDGKEPRFVQINRFYELLYGR